LGGNRKGTIRTYVNLMITMLLGGLWHGASLKFVFWGGLHGMALAFHKLVSGIRISNPLPQTLRKFLPFGSAMITFHFVCFCWIFFRAASMNISWQIIGRIFQDFDLKIFFVFIAGYKGVVILMIVGYALHLLPKTVELRAQQQVTKAPLLAKAGLVAFVILVIVQIKSAAIQPFIYFQF
jgi:alginate O-acetyltransferase complex protein AlgI